jgi:dUTPase
MEVKIVNLSDYPLPEYATEHSAGMDLKAYIKAFKERKIKRIEKEILTLQKQLELFKTQTERWDF